MTEQQWGRVGDDGTVYVRTADGERAVGQFPDATPDKPDEALAFYTKRFDALTLEVELLEQRVKADTVSPDDARASCKKLRTSILQAQAVGDLDGLVKRLDALAPLIDAQREHRKAERAQKTAQAKAAKSKIVAEAEQIARGNDWRGGADRMRALLDEWRALPRLDRHTDDDLWHRFSGARTAYTRRRKQHFGELSAKRDAAAAVKKKLVTEALALQNSTDWGPTSGAYRELMRQWKAAGPAPRQEENKLWERFRAAQDVFFNARDAANAEENKEQVANRQVKERLLDQAEAEILPVTDPRQARKQLRAFLDRYDEHGKVPRDAMRPLDQRLRALEDAVKRAEDKRWKQTNPEGRARAQATVDQLNASIADLESKAAKADERGDAKKAREARESIEARKLWLAEAQKALDEFS